MYLYPDFFLLPFLVIDIISTEKVDDTHSNFKMRANYNQGKIMFFSASYPLTSFHRVAGYTNMFVGSVFQLDFLPPKTYFFLGNLTLNSSYAETPIDESNTGFSSVQHRSVIGQ